jgi:hypothetical protein
MTQDAKRNALHDLPMWVVTENPSDMPGMFVARLNIWNDEARTYVPTNSAVARRRKEELWIEMQRKGLTFVMRDPNDAPQIVGVFL